MSDRRIPGSWALRAAVPVAALGLLLALAGPAPAFHDGGVAHCGGCHTMHNSEDGAPVGSGDPYLLLYATATELCLSCHATSYGRVLGTDPLNPPPELGGGNFVFLLEDNLNDAPGGQLNPIAGNHAGHSIVAPSWGLFADPDHLVAPGGTFPSVDLECTSCHDPHGSASFRMLRGVGPVKPGGSFTFLYPAPEGEGVDATSGVESPTSHTAYQAGWSDWCANCHGMYHQSGTSLDHPVDQSLGNEWQVYNQYDGPLNPYGGSYATAYLPEVPIEDPNRTSTDTYGAIGASRLMCMTCHRAHATSAPAALRWDPNVLRLSDDGIESGSWPIPNPYGDPEQRALCVKCHYPEAVGHGMDQACLSCHLQSLPFAGHLD